MTVPMIELVRQMSEKKRVRCEDNSLVPVSWGNDFKSVISE